jgi:D-alanyl-D-alanine endopeptidase (penicillin-binding protein 7)
MCAIAGCAVTRLSPRAVAVAALLALPMAASAGNTGGAQDPAQARGLQAPATTAGTAAAPVQRILVASGNTRQATRHRHIIHRKQIRSAPHAKQRHAAHAARATTASLDTNLYTLDQLSSGRVLHSAVAYMVDQNTGTALIDKNSTKVVPIASITKLMTAMVVLDSGTSLAEPIRVTEEDKDLEKHTGSRLKVGSVLSREDMLHIALMASENRAAAALSRYYPGGRPAFIDAMNRKARELGMTDTHFENVAGLSKNNVSTARDLVKMVLAASHYPLIRLYSTDQSYTVYNGKGSLEYHSTNMLLGKPGWDIGLQKTGFINESGICLVMQATIEDRPVVMVLLNSTRRHADFADAQHLRIALENDVFPAGTTSRNVAKTDAYPM